MAEKPFTLAGHTFDPQSDALTASDAAMPPKHNYPGSPANYWLVDEQILANMQWTVTPADPTVPVFKSPHVVVEGTVEKIIHETDGDVHVWLTFDGTSKGRLACEWTPQTKVTPPPPAGSRIRVYGILRYDLQHGWPEIHPVDNWEALDGSPVGATTSGTPGS